MSRKRWGAHALALLLKVVLNVQMTLSQKPVKTLICGTPLFVQAAGASVQFSTISASMREIFK
eukprot:823717-Pyramimonas_sp.AAC.1